jgi:eukaryotic-like serine/threonine-protein kinase
MTSSSLEEWKGIFAPDDLVSSRYRIVRLLGAGGTSEVYAAADTALGEEVALKTLSAGLAQSPVGLERFRREIYLSRRVTHPNVCRIFDLGEHEAPSGRRTLFFTMELVAGPSLSERLESGPPFTPEEALPLITQIAAGLQAAHESGVVHRDLKPGNIMLSPARGNGAGVRVVITDFGLARHQDPGTLGLTESGEMLGTPCYMSPEQVRGATITPASDIYALGIVIYEMLARALPFQDVNPLATALRRLRLPPTPIRSHVPSLPGAWVAAIERCLAVEPAERFARPLDVVAALDGDGPAPAAPSGPAGWLASLVHRRDRKRQP